MMQKYTKQMLIIIYIYIKIYVERLIREDRDRKIGELSQQNNSSEVEKEIVSIENAAVSIFFVQLHYADLFL